METIPRSVMIVPVGNWVLEQALRDLRQWRSLGLGPVRVSINVSALQLRRRTFVDDVLEIAKGLNEGGFGLDLEITETSLLQDLDVITAKLTGIEPVLQSYMSPLGRPVTSQHLRSCNDAPLYGFALIGVSPYSQSSRPASSYS